MRIGQDENNDQFKGNYEDLVNQEVLHQGAGQNTITDPTVRSPDPTQQPYESPTINTYQDRVNKGTIEPPVIPPPPPVIEKPSAPGPWTQTQGPVAPPSFGGPTGPAAPPQTAASSIPPDLISILNSLKEGITNFQVPQINYQPQTTPAYDDLVRSAIMDAIRQGQQPVDASDPLVAPLLAAVQGQAQRAKESNQNTLAEQLSAKHLLSSGAYDVGRERYNQGIDEATGGTLAQVMTQVLSQRQQRLMQAIQMGSNYLNADQARQLQAELANVNSALGQYQAKSSVGLGTLASLLQNQQFYDSLGANLGMFASQQNANAGSF